MTFGPKNKLCNHLKEKKIEEFFFILALFVKQMVSFPEAIVLHKKYICFCRKKPTYFICFP